MSDGSSLRVLGRESYRVRMSDVDATGMIYHVSPFLWREGLFSNWMAGCGHPVGTHLARGEGASIISASVEFRRPISLDEAVTLQLIALEAGTSSFKLRMDALADDAEPSVQVVTTNVWVEIRQGQVTPRPLPDWLRLQLV